MARTISAPMTLPMIPDGSIALPVELRPSSVLARNPPTNEPTMPRRMVAIHLNPLASG